MGGTDSAASAASNASNVASSVGNATGYSSAALDTAGTAASSAGNASSALDAFSAGNAANASSTTPAWMISAGNESSAPMYSSDLGGQISGATNQAMSNVDKFGTTDPTIGQQLGDTISRFYKGMNSDLPQAYKNFGNNPETYGYAYGKLSSLMSGGSSPSAGAVTTNINYEQPSNEYLKKKRYLYG